MERLIINSITMLFVTLIITYTILTILSNQKLYEFISQDLKRLNAEFRSADIYQNTKTKYMLYLNDNKNANINLSSFVEEIAGDILYREKTVLERIKKIKSSSSNAILFGVLGTFIGLSAMLFTINTSDIINSLPNTLDSMQTAFITSVCGIIASIILNTYIESKNCESILTQVMLKIENLLTAEITHIRSNSIDSKVEEVKDTIKDINKSIKSIERFDQISKDLNEFNNTFISGVEALKDILFSSKDSLKTFDEDIRKLDKQFSIMNLKFKALFDKYDNMDEINKDLLNTVLESNNNIKESTKNQESVKEYIKGAVSSLALYERNTEDLLNKLMMHEADMVDKTYEMENDKSSLDKSIEKLSKSILVSSKDLSKKLSAMDKSFKDYEKSLLTTKKKLEDDIYDFDENELLDELGDLDD
ncbi:MAG: MotA/TolQ/ExbB proton channel family protein [Peptostreptococcaceae bacterium]